MVKHQAQAEKASDEVALLKKYSAKPYAELKKLTDQSNCPIHVRDESIASEHGQKLLRRVFLADRQSAGNGWVLNEDSSDCQDCGSKFHVSRRRHHCRKCGNIFCSKCIRRQSKVLICHQCHYVRLSFSVSAHQATDERHDSLSRLESDIPTPPLQLDPSSHASDLQSSDTDRAQLQSQIDETKELFAVAEMDNLDLRQELLDVHNQLNDERSRKLTLRVDLDQVRAKLFLAIDEGTRLQTELDDLREKLASAERCNANLVQQRLQAEQSLQQAQEQAILLEAELGTLHASLQAREKVCAQLLVETELRRKKLLQLTEDNVKLRVELEQTAKLQESEGTEHDQLQVDSATAALKASHEEGVQIQDRVEELSARVKAGASKTPAAKVSPTATLRETAGTSRERARLRASVATSAPSRLRTLSPEIVERPHASGASIPGGDTARSAAPLPQAGGAASGAKAASSTKKGPTNASKSKGPRASLR